MYVARKERTGTLFSRQYLVRRCCRYLVVGENTRSINREVVYQTQEGQYVLCIIILNTFKYPDKEVYLYLMTGEEDIIR